MGCCSSYQDPLAGDLSKVEKFTYAGFKGRARVIGVHDGDTVTVVFVDTTRVAPHNMIRTNLRVAGVDAPEVVPKHSTPHYDLHKKCGVYVQQYVHNMLDNRIVDIEILCDDKYSGRFVARIICGKTDLSEDLLQRGYALKYDGKKKSEWTLDALQAILKN